MTTTNTTKSLYEYKPSYELLAEQLQKQYGLQPDDKADGGYNDFAIAPFSGTMDKGLFTGIAVVVWNRLPIIYINIETPCTL